MCITMPRRKDLVRGLCWKWSSNSTRNQSADHYGPAWSWAKMNVPITYGLIREDRVFASRSKARRFTHVPVDSRFIDPEILHASMVPEGRDPHGTLISGMIYIRGQLLQLHRSKAGDYSVEGKSLRITYDHLSQPQVDLSIPFKLRANKCRLDPRGIRREERRIRASRCNCPYRWIGSQISLLKT